MAASGPLIDPRLLDPISVGIAPVNDRMVSLGESIEGLHASIDETTAAIRELERGLGFDGDTSPRGAEEPAPVDSIAVSEVEARRIEQRFRGEVSISAQLDGLDLVAAVAAGAVGSLVDVALGGPASSAVTRKLRGLALPADNSLGKRFPVPFDSVSPAGGPQLTPLNHRFHSVGHDPLLGLVYGTADIMRGTMTVTDAAGRISALQSRLDPVSGVGRALMIEIGHLLSDVVTSSGLPLPGWTLFGATGSEAVARLARDMFVRGYDSWHLASMSTSSGAIELLCRAYFGLRCAEERDVMVGASVAEDPRYEAISLIAHCIAATADVAEVLATGNPLRFNWVQGLQAARRLTHELGRRSAPMPEQLTRTVGRNRREIDAGWATLLADSE